MLARYESVRSPLDLGSQQGRIAAGTRISYVPAAALVVRTEALRAIGGFDESLRTGEDVDMVWRLIEAGHRCRYEPASTVRHRPRATLSAWVRQRMAYGRSAATLDRQHPGSVAPLRMSGWSAAVWALVFARRPVVAVIVAGGTVVALRRKLNDLPSQESLRLAGLGHLYAGRQVANTITRVWWPFALFAAVFVRRSRLPLARRRHDPAIARLARQSWPVRPTCATWGSDSPTTSPTEQVCGSAPSSNVASAPLAPEFTNWPGRARR